MCHRCSACCLNYLRGSDVANDDDDVRPVSSLLSSCDEFKDSRCLAHIMSICRTCEQAAEGDFFSQAEPQRRSGHREKWLLTTCVLFFLLAFTFLKEEDVSTADIFNTLRLTPKQSRLINSTSVGSIGKEGGDAQDYDADIFLPSKALWLLGCLLFWTIWLLLRLLQVFLWSIKGLLWLISISASPLCRCVSFLLSCTLLLLHYTCDAVFFATTCPVYVYSMLLGVVLLLIFTRRKLHRL